MSDSDYLVDRRRMARKVTFWRVAAFAVACAAIVGLALAFGDREFGARAQAHVAKIEISGVITGDDKTLDLIKRVGESAAPRAVLVEINSPGGTVTGSELLFDALRELSAKKPTVAVVSGMAASGGYIAAMGTDRIVAQQTSLVGSIGVLFQMPNVVGLLDKIGVTVETVKSAPLKAAPSPFERSTPEAQEALRSLVVSSFDWFKGLVSSRRGITGQELATVSDGRVFTGSQALGLRLVDELGAQKQAVAWLEKEKGIAKDLPVKEWKRTEDRALGLFGIASSVAGAVGLRDLAGGLKALDTAAARPVLDGMLALWQP
ncbi:signal peptide peptidase SppA [Alsobacter sp. SYSU M60028]|uniref:Signal peptide peptidase SppA n=1 Tax=Alsobacter ponti TaxID=2962936 RepID=A0ABT1LBF7_9HYPH|nr:signal peptide peptidase SppA [Alsobacter ponti]MCP8938817.1 signal peptide peptidase SppA [Alsobacter ponti]